MAKIEEVLTINIAVRDLEEASKNFANMGLTAMPPVYLPDPRMQMIDLSFPFPRGGFSLISPLPGTTDGPVSRFLDRKGEGVYSIALIVDNMAELMQEWGAQGLRWVLEEPIIQKDAEAGKYKVEELKINWVLPKSFFGTMLEIFEFRGKVENPEPAKSHIQELLTVNIAVNDLEEGEALLRKMGLKPMPPVHVTEPSMQMTDLSFPFQGGAFSLISPYPRGNTEGAVAKFLERKGQGVNNISLRVDDINETMRDWEKTGIKWVFQSPMATAGEHTIDRMADRTLGNWSIPRTLHNVMLEMFELQGNVTVLKPE